MNSRWTDFFGVISTVILLENSMAALVANDQSADFKLPKATIEKLFGVSGDFKASDNKTIVPERETGIAQQVVGEDVGEQSENAELLMIRQQMQHHLELIQEHSNGDEVKSFEPLQFEILQRLDSLIQSERQRIVSTVVAMPGKGQAGQQAGVGTVGETSEDASAPIVVPESGPLESNWNQLPPTVQIPLRESSANPFLPGYENLLQQFYKSLMQR